MFVEFTLTAVVEIPDHHQNGLDDMCFGDIGGTVLVQSINSNLLHFGTTNVKQVTQED